MLHSVKNNEIAVDGRNRAGVPLSEKKKILAENYLFLNDTKELPVFNTASLVLRFCTIRASQM